MLTNTARIRALNDRLRVTGCGGAIVITAGIASLSEDAQLAICAAVQIFSDFSAGNDPYGEHDFGLVEAAGQRVMFKIDYYDLLMTGHSPDASDPTRTRRVLTIMLASEY